MRMPASKPSFPARARGFALALARSGARLRLAQAAASLAFLSLLAIVPVFTIAVSLLGALPMFEGLRDEALKFVAANLFLPSFSDTLVGYLNEFAEKSAELSLIGGLLFFASAFSALITIEGTLNRIWDSGHRRSLARRLTVYWTFLTLGPLLLAASTAMNGLLVSRMLSGAAPPQLQTAWVLLVPWITTIGGLTLLYRLVPSAPVRWSDALVGALAAAVALDLLKRGMAFQVARLPTYTVVYGTFAALPLFFVWLFMLWLTVLAGALVAANAEHWRTGVPWVRGASPGARFDTAAAVLLRLAQAQADGRAAVRAGEMRDLFAGDAARAAQVARVLGALGYLERTWRIAQTAEGQPVIWDEWWMLAADAPERTLRPLFECVWNDTAPAREPPARRLDLSRIDRPLSASARGPGATGPGAAEASGRGVC